MTKREGSTGDYWGNSTSGAHILQQVDGSPEVDFGSFGSITNIAYSSFIGYDTPNYRELREENKIIPYTDWKQKSVQGEIRVGDYWLRSDEGQFEQWSTGVSSCPRFDLSSWYSVPRSYEDAELENDFGISYESLGRDQVQKAAASIYSEGWDGLTFVSELHKVVGLFKNFVRKWAGIDPRKLHEMWLEGRYGWRILMYDIEDINKLINGIDASRSRFKERSGLGGSESRVVLENQDYLDRATTFIVHKDTISWSIRGSIVADISPPEIAMNAVTTGWELITFSFVIDWIIDIGQWLEAMSFLVMQTNYEAARGLQLSIERETTIAGTSTSHYSDFIVNHESYCVGTFTRRLPCGVSKLPSFGMNLNALKIVDILALLAKFRR